MIDNSSRLELHYYFKDSSHTMDAVLRNECERELLKMFKEAASQLNIQLDIETEAYLEGGLKEIWKFLGKNATQITLILAVLTVILSRVPVENKELTRLQIENLELDNKLKKAELKRVEKEVESGQISEELVEEIVKRLEENYKVVWHKSVFFKKLSFYPKLSQVSTTRLDEEYKPIDTEVPVPKSEFPKFILRSDELPPFIDDAAVIDIISPVLKKGNYSWKGFYNGESVSFKMKDVEFKKSILNKQIEFVNGIAIRCVLKQARKIDETGQIKITKSEVLTVIEVIMDHEVSETDQGKKFLRSKKALDNQMDLDF